MKDLIRRSDAIEALKDNVIEMGGDDFCEMGVHIDDIEAVFNAIPSAVRPRGKWIKDKWTNIWGKEIDCYRCSNCGIRGINHSLLLDITGYNYCPNCGEWMRGVNDE